MAATHRMIAWAQIEQATLIRRVVDEAGITLVGIGSPVSADGAALSQAFDVPRIAELRKAILDEEADLLWVAAPQPVEAAERSLIEQRGLRTLCSEPLASMNPSRFEAAETPVLRFGPLMRRSPGFAAAVDVLSDFGEPQAASICFRCAKWESSLFARLFDAMSTIEALFGETEAINASLSSPTGHAPDSLHNLRGCLTMNMQFTNSANAAVTVSDRAGSWFRGMTVFGQRGVLRIADGAMDWIHPENGDESREQRSAEPMMTAAQLVARQIVRMLEQRDANEPPLESMRLLALCETARLSCRTGATETPGRMLEMMSRP